MKEGRAERYWVDESGRAELAEAAGSRGRYLVLRLLMGAALLLFFALLAVIFAVDQRKVLLILLLAPALAAVMVLGGRNDPESRLARGLKRGADGRHWIEIRTREADEGE